MKFILKQPRKVILLAIRAYQKTISPDHGMFRPVFPYGYCPFSPSCSEYGYQAIAKYGIFRGGLKTIWRIARCNPWNKSAGGDDPIN